MAADLLLKLRSFVTLLGLFTLGSDSSVVLVDILGEAVIIGSTFSGKSDAVGSN